MQGGRFYIAELYDFVNRKIMSRQHLSDKYNINIDVMFYNQITSCIPKTWKAIIKDAAITLSNLPSPWIKIEHKFYSIFQTENIKSHLKTLKLEKTTSEKYWVVEECM